jgi:glycosyltransferase involved in cell wall biosynthesis
VGHRRFGAPRFFAKAGPGLEIRMRILFHCPFPLKKELGAAKVLIELAEAMEKIGWDCVLVSNEDIPDGADPGPHRLEKYHQAMKKHLLEQAPHFDVVDYDQVALPFPRSTFPPGPLFVARSAILRFHIRSMRVPEFPAWNRHLKHLYHRAKNFRRERKYDRAVWGTFRGADLINVANGHDVRTLEQLGFAREKIVLLHYGIGADRRQAFEAVSAEAPAKPVVVFVGSFDNRKGGPDLPKIFSAILKRHPETRFKLLGTAAIHNTVEAVMSYFPEHLRNRMEVMPRFPSAQLPELLRDCSVGIFPSYIEGFGFGVLEMLAAAVPVFAYDAPGPPEMLPAKYLVPPGDIKSLAEKACVLLENKSELNAARLWARERSREFAWPRIAEQTSAAYRQHWEARRDPARKTRGADLQARGN